MNIVFLHADARPTSTPMQQQDAFILTRHSDLGEDSGVVQGLRAAGLRVCVLSNMALRARKEAEGEAQGRKSVLQDVRDVALCRTDRVTVAEWNLVRGLERRLVVTLPGFREGDEGYSPELRDFNDRLEAASRCTTQLIRVEMDE